MNSEEKMDINVNSLKSLYITIYYNETKLGTASGFIVKEKEKLYLITNRHVVTGRNNQTNDQIPGCPQNSKNAAGKCSQNFTHLRKQRLHLVQPAA